MATRITGWWEWTAVAKVATGSQPWMNMSNVLGWWDPSYARTVSNLLSNQVSDTIELSGLDLDNPKVPYQPVPVDDIPDNITVTGIGILVKDLYYITNRVQGNVSAAGSSASYTVAPPYAWGPWEYMFYIPGLSMTRAELEALTVQYFARGLWDFQIPELYSIVLAFVDYELIEEPDPDPDPAPTVMSITPDYGLRDDADVDVIITGAGFQMDADVTLRLSGQSDIVGSSVVVVNSTTITCSFDLTGAEVDFWDVVVTNSDLQYGTLPAGFEVQWPAPTVTAITPDSGANDEAAFAITSLEGTGFRDDADVKLTRAGEDDIVATSVVVVGATEITCVFDLTDAEVGDWNVVVTNDDDKSGQLDDGFEVTWPAPTVLAVSPNTNIEYTHQLLALTGTGFRSDATMTLRKGALVINFTGVLVDSPTTMGGDMDNYGQLEAGAYDVRVTNDDGQYGELVGGYTVAYRTPTVASITPAFGPNHQSCNITNLAGAYFRARATVKLTRAGQSDINGTSVVVVSSTKITCVLPITGAQVGDWNVVVTNDDAQSATLPDGFEVIYPAPVVTGITPSSGINNAPVDITNLAGQYFRATPTAIKLTKLGYSDISATSIVFVSSTKLTCAFDITDAAVGLWNVVVTNPDGQSGGANNLFLVKDPPEEHEYVLAVRSSGKRLRVGHNIGIW